MVKVTTSERIVSKTPTAINVGQEDMLQTCAELPTIQVKMTIYVCIVVAKTTPQEIAGGGPMTKESSPSQHHRHPHNVGPHLMANTENLGAPQKYTNDPRNTRPANTENSGKYTLARYQGDHLPYKDYRYVQDSVGCQ